MGRAWIIGVAAGLLAVAGCGPKGPADVHELAAALRAQGVDYHVTETAALANLRTEGLRLMGEGLTVDVYRIEDEADLKLAAAVAAMAARAQVAKGEVRPLKPYVVEPYLVIVREEPVEGQVQAALEAVFSD